jgi:hypothetical protein
MHQLHAHIDRQSAADDAREDREDQVERADILVVGAHQPALDEAQLVVVMIAAMICADGRTMVDRAGLLG